jgi:predicted MFS family arabinose efflux permease
MALPFYAVGSLTKPLTDANGWSRSDVQTAILLCVGVGAAVAPLVSRLVERYGPRPVAIGGLLGVSASFFLAAAAGSSIMLFHASFILMAFLGAGSNPISWTRGIVTSFERELGLALGLTLTGTGICAILAPQFTTWMIARFGVQMAIAGLGLIPLVIALPLVLLFFRPVPPSAGYPDHPTAASDGMTLAEARRTYRFWALFTSVACIYLAQAGIITNLIPAIGDRGFSAHDAANFQSVLGISIIVGRVAIGLLIDRIWAPGVAAVVTSLPVLACLTIPESSGYLPILASTIVLGLATGAELDFLAFLTARYFGTRHYATIYAVIYAALAIAGGVAPFGFAAFYDHFGSYTPAFHIAAGLYAVGSLLVLTLGRYPKSFSRPQG